MAKKRNKKRKVQNNTKKLNELPPEERIQAVGEIDSEIFEEEDPIEAAKEFLSKHGFTILLAILVVIGSIFLYTRWQENIISQRNTAWASLHQASSSEQALEVAEEHKSNPELEVLALNKAADFMFNDAMKQAPKAIPDEKAKAKLNEAKALYEKVISKAPADINGRPNLIVLNSLFAIGKVYESLGDKASAEKQYNQIISRVDEWATGKSDDIANEAYAINNKKTLAEGAVRALKFLSEDTFLSNRPAAPVATQPASAGTTPQNITLPSTQPAEVEITIPATTQPSN